MHSKNNNTIEKQAKDNTGITEEIQTANKHEKCSDNYYASIKIKKER